MDLAIERQHVVLAHGEEVDIFYDDHLTVFFFEFCSPQHLFRVNFITTS